MKALSIQQPWAWAIFHGKPVENRSWYTSVRGRILIHTGKKVDTEAFFWIEDKFGLIIPHDLPTGGIVGEVELYDCVKKFDSQWFFGPWGFLMRNQKELPFRSCRGQLGFFEVPE
jgi:hypothetical protein